jgi:1,4-dihydroxy-6-naphthoate synthase
MFYALATGKIPSGGFEIEHVIEDIESLNERAFRSELEVTALSAHAFGHLSDRYELLPYGAGVGEGYGPVLVANSNGNGNRDGSIFENRKKVKNRTVPILRRKKIAVPGRYTTAFLVLQLYETDFQPVFTSFDRVFATVRDGQADFGLVIHEGQLTYQELGFQKVLDLGQWWQKQFQLPLPLGVNVIRRDLGEEVVRGFSQLFRESIDYAMTHREEAIGYALKFGRGIDARRGDEFVGMYVNELTLAYGQEGRRAVELLLQWGFERGILPRRIDLDFVE